MELTYFIKEKVEERARKGEYVPVSLELIPYHKQGSMIKYPWEILSVGHNLQGRTDPVYLVMYIQHTGRDHDNKYFFNEEDARRYIWYLAKAIVRKEGVEVVDVHYDSGKKNIYELLENIPLNSYTSFRTAKDTFSITLGKTYKFE